MLFKGWGLFIFLISDVLCDMFWTLVCDDKEEQLIIWANNDQND